MSRKHHVTMEEVEDSGDEQQRLNRNQSSQQPSGFVYDACESAKQTYAPSDRNAGWVHKSLQSMILFY